MIILPNTRLLQHPAYLLAFGFSTGLQKNGVGITAAPDFL